MAPLPSRSRPALRRAGPLLAACLCSGCLLLADPPTSVKRLEPEPTVSFDTPAADGLVHGVAEVRVALRSTLEVEGRLLLDGEEVARGSGPTLAWDWDTTAVARGAHALTAIVTDEVDREAETAISVVVDQLPVVRIDAPAPGDTLEGSLDLDLSIEDDGEVRSATLLVDGVEVDADDSSPWSLALDTCDLADGTRVLRVEALDDAGNVGAAEVEVSTLRPMSIAVERHGAHADPDDTLAAAVAWDEGVERIWFELDGAEIASFDEADGATCADGCDDRCREVSAPWDTTDLAEGSYTLAAFLLDTTGREVSDEATVTVDRDVDGDGHDHEGYGGDDCDDDESGVHPGAVEACDDVDQDCDGTVDEGFDLDGDGFAGGSTCPDETWVDCDDADPDVNPDAPEICGDGIDNDCDGPDGDCRLEGAEDVSALGWASLDGETEEDLIGTLVGPVGDLDGDGHPDLLVGSWTMDSTATDAGYSGGVYVVSGAIEAGNHGLDESIVHVEGTGSETGFGYASAPLGDVDLDGYDDFAIGEPGTSYGTVWLFDGPLSGRVSPSAAEATLAWTGSVLTGWSLAAGDLDGDADTDLVAGTCKTGSTRNVAVYRGPLTSTLSSPHLYLSDPNDGGAGCAAATAPDTDGDGLDDLLLGAPSDDSGGEDAGAVWLVTDLPSSTSDLSDVDAAFIRGRASGWAVGWEVAGAGDTDGDGYGDVLIGTFAYTTAGAGHAWLFLGPVSGTTTVGSADAEFNGDDGDEAGSATAGLDLDGDGFSDLALASPFASSASYNGVVSVFYGPVPSGSHDLPADADLEIRGSDPDGWLGYGLASPGDVDLDGCDDLLLGAPEVGADDAGRAWLLLGRSGF